MGYKQYLHKHLVLDGYNVLNAVQPLKKHLLISLEDGRGALLEAMKEYSAITGEHVVIVFDAYKGKTKTTTIEKFKAVEMVFTKENETADSYIEMLVQSLCQNKRNMVRVVTSDWAEQQIVLGSGAARVAPHEFYDHYLSLKSGLKKEYAHKPAFSTLESRISKQVYEALESLRRGK